MSPDRIIWEWVDIAGGFLRASDWVGALTSTGPLEVAMQNASHANLQYVTIAAPTIGATTPTGAQYSLVSDIAIFNFSTVPGAGIQVIVPAPDNSLFGSNSTVIDPTSTLAAAIISNVIGVLTDINGNVVTAYVSGSKGNRRTEQT